jgi:ABC-type dipeptide transport system, periplasmic component
MDRTISKKKIKWIITAAAAVMISVCLAGCGTGSSTTTSSGGTEYQTKNEVLLAMNSVKTLNPAISTDEDTYYITKLIYDGLYSLDNELTPTKNLAKRIAVNQAAKSITVVLVKTNFQDGRQLTATDVVFSVQAYKAEGSKCRYYDLVKDITSVRKINSRTCRIYFDSASDMSVAHLTFPILPAHRYDYSVSTLLAAKQNFRPVGTGQYKYSSFDTTRLLTLKAYADYHGDMAVNTVKISVIPNKSAASAFNLIQSSTISLLISKSPTREGSIEKSAVKIKNFASSQMEMIGFNIKKTEMENKTIRQAIATAVNNKAIIQNCYSGSGMRNDNLYYPGYLGVKSSGDRYAYDLDKAAVLFEDAGYADDDHDDMLEDEEGKELTLTILVNNSSTRYSAVKIISRSLKSLGIHVNVVRSTSEKAYLKALKKGDYDLFYGGYSMNELSDLRDILSTDGTSNFIGYSNTKLDRYLNQMGFGIEEDTAVNKYKQIKQVINSDLPYYCVLYKTYGAIKAPSLEGTVSPSFNNYYYGCGNWKCKYEVTGSSSTSTNATDNAAANKTKSAAGNK